MKRFLTIILSIVVCLGIPVKVSAASDTTIFSSGVTMSTAEFHTRFVGSQPNTQSVTSLESSQVKFSNNILSLNSLKTSVELVLQDGTTTSFDITGDIYAGYKTAFGDVNSVIVDSTCTDTNISVLLFEMLFAEHDSYSEQTKKSFFINDSLKEGDSFRLYLLIEQQLYMFEDVLPNEFAVYNDHEYIQITDPLKDLLWFAAFVNPKIEIIENEEGKNTELLIPFSSDAGSDYWAGDKVYQTSFEIGGSTYVQSSCPFGYYRICDVSTSDATWRGGFYISESTLIDGVTVDYVENVIRYKNVSIAVTVGKDTEFSSSITNGSYFKRNSLINRDAIADILSAFVDWWDKGIGILEVVKSVTDTGKDATFGEDFISIVEPGVTCIEVSVPYSRCEFFKNGFSISASNNIDANNSAKHFLKLDVGVYSTLNASTSQLTTTGAIQFTWDVFLSSTLDDIQQGVQKSFTKSYLNQH